MLGLLKQRHQRIVEHCCADHVGIECLSPEVVCGPGLLRAVDEDSGVINEDIKTTIGLLYVANSIENRLFRIEIELQA